MTISKRLQEQLDKKTKILIEIFKNEFLKTKNKKEFKDGRVVKFLDSSNEDSKFFFFGEDNEEDYEDPEEMREFASVIFKVDVIIVRINYKGIKQGGFFHTTPEIFLKNFDYFKKIIEQIARHEYGHSFLTKTDFEGYPKNVRSFLKKINSDDIFNVPESKIEDLKKAFRESDYGRIDESLKIVDLHLVEKLLKEFHADFSVFNKIDNSPLKESLRLTQYELNKGLKDTAEWRTKFYSSSNFDVKDLSKYFFFIKVFTQKYYIHNNWNMLVDGFDMYQLSNLLKLYHVVNGIIKKIIKKYDTFDKMRECIFELALAFDKFNFEKIFFNNQVVQEDILSLKTIIDKLNE